MITALPGSAQVNTEAMRAAEVEGWTATVGADGALRAGNSELVEVGGALRVDYRVDRHYAFVVARSRYSEAEGATTQNDSFVHLRYNYQLRPWLVGEVFAQGQRDALTLLQLRLLTGGGIRVRYVESARLRLYQGTSLMAESENLEADRVHGHPAAVTVARWSNYLNARIAVDEDVAFSTTLYVQPRLDVFSDVRMLTDATLRVGLSDRLAYTAVLQLSYDSRPPQTVEDLDVALRNGVSLTF